MKRILLAVAIAAPLFNPISAAALQTERDVQGITRVEERIARARAQARWDRWVSEVQMRLEAATAQRMQARYEEPTEFVSESYSPGEGALSADRVAFYARQAGFPESVISTMVSIAWRESRFDPGAINPFSGACGLWQMYPCPGSHALFPATNAAMAYDKYQAACPDCLSPWGY